MLTTLVLLMLFILASIKSIFAHIPWLIVPDPLLACSIVQLTFGAPQGNGPSDSGGPPFLIAVYNLPDQIFLDSDFNLSTLNETSQPLFSFPIQTGNRLNWTITLPPNLRITFQVCNAPPNPFAGWCDIGSVRVIHNTTDPSCLGPSSQGIVGEGVAQTLSSQNDIIPSLSSVALATPSLSRSVEEAISSQVSIQSRILTVANSINASTSLLPAQLSDLITQTQTSVPSTTGVGSSSESNSGSSHRVVVIIGSILGALGFALLALICLCCCCFSRYRRSKRRSKSPDDGMGAYNKNWPFLTLPMSEPTKEMGFKPKPSKFARMGESIWGKVESIIVGVGKKVVTSVV